VNILYRYCGGKISTLRLANYSELLDTIQTYTEYTKIDKYTGHFYYMEIIFEGVKTLLVNNRLPKFNGPTTVAMHRNANPQNTPASPKLLTEIYITEELIDKLNASYFYIKDVKDWVRIDKQLLSYMELYTGEKIFLTDSPSSV